MSNKNGGALSAHLKKQNIFFWLSALCSVAIIALMFLPWLDTPKSASILTMLIDTIGKFELMFFLIPVFLGVIIVHVLYLVTMMMPGRDETYLGTVSVLLAGIMILLFLFASDIAYSAITVTDKVYTDKFLEFIGADTWTWTPVIWFVLTLVQKLLLTRFAHKKVVISYT